jgi:hypothetical protein
MTALARGVGHCRLADLDRLADAIANPGGTMWVLVRFEQGAACGRYPPRSEPVKRTGRFWFLSEHINPETS